MIFLVLVHNGPVQIPKRKDQGKAEHPWNLLRVCSDLLNNVFLIFKQYMSDFLSPSSFRISSLKGKKIYACISYTS